MRFIAMLYLFRLLDGSLGSFSWRIPRWQWWKSRRIRKLYIYDNKNKMA